MTIGDVLAFVAGILAACASLWAAILVMLLVFSKRTEAVSERIEQQPWRCVGAGGVFLFLAGAVTLILVNQPNGLLKLIGWLSLAFLLAFAVFGSAGLSRVVAGRILATDTAVPPFRAAGYGAGLLVATGLFPVLGWLILIVSLLTSLGAAALTLRPRKKAKALAPIAEPIPAVVPRAAEYAHE